MFLRNWYKSLALYEMAKDNSYISISAVDTDGVERALWNKDSSQAHYAINIYNHVATVNKAINSNFYKGIAFGTGNTPPTFDDYKLAGSVISTISAVSAPTFSFDEDGLTLTTVYTMTNTGTADITVGEIGMFARQYYQNSTNYYKNFLIERTALDTPVTIPAGGVGQVTYTIHMPYPT